MPDGNEQNLQMFVNQSTWDPVPVQGRICERMLPLIEPADTRTGSATAPPAIGSDVTTIPTATTTTPANVCGHSIG